MFIRKILGFSLVEVMVAIALIVTLVTMSVGLYVSYTSKSRFAGAFESISKYKNDLQLAYMDNDQFPDQFSILTASSYTDITEPELNMVYYGVATNRQAAYMHFFTTDLGLEGYESATSGAGGGVKSRIALVAVSNNTGHVQFYCGQWNGSSVDVPLEYLPKSCQDTNMSALIS